jgi:hypothetical protein
MREQEVLDGGRLKLSCEERKAFFKEDLRDQVRGGGKRQTLFKPPSRDCATGGSSRS